MRVATASGGRSSVRAARPTLPRPGPGRQTTTALGNGAECRAPPKRGRGGVAQSSDRDEKSAWTRRRVRPFRRAARCFAGDRDDPPRCPNATAVSVVNLTA